MKTIIDAFVFTAFLVFSFGGYAIMCGAIATPAWIY